MNDAGHAGHVDEPMEPGPVLLETSHPAGGGGERQKRQAEERELADEDELPLEDVLPDRIELAGARRIAQLIEHQVNAQMRGGVRERPQPKHSPEVVNLVDA